MVNFLTSSYFALAYLISQEETLKIIPRIGTLAKKWERYTQGVSSFSIAVVKVFSKNCKIMHFKCNDEIPQEGSSRLAGGGLVWYLNCTKTVSGD